MKYMLMMIGVLSLLLPVNINAQWIQHGAQSEEQPEEQPEEQNQDPPVRHPLRSAEDSALYRRQMREYSGPYHLAIECEDSACIGLLHELTDSVHAAAKSNRYELTVSHAALEELRNRGYRLLPGAPYDPNSGRKVITVTAAKVVPEFKSSKHRIRPEDDPGMRVWRQDVAGLLRAVEARRAAAAKADSNTLIIRRGDRYFCPAL